MILSTTVRALVTGSLFAVCGAMGGTSEAAVNAPQILSSARKALGEKIPQVAISKVEEVLEQPGISEAERLTATQLLAEAQLAVGNFQEALSALESMPRPLSEADRLLLARAYVGLNQWSAALDVYRQWLSLIHI